VRKIKESKSDIDRTVLHGLLDLAWTPLPNLRGNASANWDIV
jgi:hypothetical protein